MVCQASLTPGRLYLGQRDRVVFRSALHIARPFFVVDRFKQKLYWLCAWSLHCARGLLASEAGTAAASSARIPMANRMRKSPYWLLSVSDTSFSTAIE